MAVGYVLVEAWLIEYNTYRPHSALGGLTPAEYAANWTSTNRGQIQWTTDRGPVKGAILCHICDRHQQCTEAPQSQVIKSRRNDGAGLRAKTTPQGPLPEICQKLCYAQPHVALRPDPQQRCSPVWLCGYVRSCQGS